MLPYEALMFDILYNGCMQTAELCITAHTVVLSNCFQFVVCVVKHFTILTIYGMCMLLSLSLGHVSYW